MKRRSKAGGPTVKARRRKSAPSKRLNATTPLPSSPNVSEDEKAARFERERNEALKQLSAASEVLGVIANSSGNLNRVFETILENATRICEATFGNLWLREDDNFRIAATHGTRTEWREYALKIDDITKLPTSGGRIVRMDRGSVVGRAAIERRPVHIPDVLTDPEYTEHEGRKIGGWRAALGVPLLREGNVIGVLFLSKAKPQAFTDKQIALVQSFAAQAVIAIENARLLSELRETLERQTATSEVLSVISSSPGKLEPVFSKMLENAARICEAKFGTLVLSEGGGKFRVVAMHGAPPEWAEKRTREPVFTPGPLNNIAIVARTKKVQHVPDLRRDRSYLDEDQAAMALADIAGARTLVVMPLIKSDEVIGMFGIYRQEVRPFTDKQIELVKNFAAQAVIAIENTRLLNELRQSLEQQIATADVLRVISSSPGDLEPVFEAMLQNATRLCEAASGTLALHESNDFRIVALHGGLIAFRDERQRQPTIRPGPRHHIARLLETRKLVHITDIATDPALAPALAEFAGARTLLTVPMLKENELVGAMGLYRQEVRPFTTKQIELVQNFAAQAVIAIENARLLNELRQRTADLSESLEQQTATSDVLGVISSSPGELQAVFDIILKNANRLCDAKFSALFIYENGLIRVPSHVDLPPPLAEHFQNRNDQPPIPGTAIETLIRTKRLIHIPDQHGSPDGLASPATTLAGARTYLAVPLLKDGNVIGAIAIFRQEVRPFTDKQIQLVQNFASQTVIAIENARLLSDLNKLNQQLEQRVADQVGEIERMSRLRRFLPPQVADLIVASGTEKQLESHRREITALFCDLRGFTGFSESSDPEDVMALLAEYHAAIGKIIFKYSGTLERYAGDGVMVIFNDPVPVENPALQAVLMALDMRTAIGGLIEKWRDLGHDLGFGIGIAHGFATLGTIGFEGRRDYAAIGTVSNVASRLCDEAKPAQILISPRVRQAVEKAVTVESVGEFALKGIRRPMLAYNVLEHSPSKLN